MSLVRLLAFVSLSSLLQLFSLALSLLSPLSYYPSFVECTHFRLPAIFRLPAMFRLSLINFLSSSRCSVVAVVVVGLAALLMTFKRGFEIGMGLLASAGVATVVVGMGNCCLSVVCFYY